MDIAPQSVQPVMPSTFQIDVADLGLRYVCRDGETLLGALERTGRRGIPAGCRGGGCGVCRVRVLSGDYRAGKMSTACVSAQERQLGMALACRVWPQSDITLVLASRLHRQVSRALTGERVADGQARQADRPVNQQVEQMLSADGYTRRARVFWEAFATSPGMAAGTPVFGPDNGFLPPDRAGFET